MVEPREEEEEGAWIIGLREPRQEEECVVDGTAGAVDHRVHAVRTAR